MRPALALAVSLVACSLHAFESDGPFPSRDYPFTVKDSGVEVAIDRPTIVEWLDEDQAIFLLRSVLGRHGGEESRSQRLIHSHLGIALSPSGCKVAFKHGEVSRFNNPHTIKMIDLCE